MPRSAGWPGLRILAYAGGLIDQELLLRCEYLAEENRILKEHIKGRLRLTDAERRSLAEIGRRLGRKLLKDVARVATPDTIMGWYHKLVAAKFDGSKKRRSPGRPGLALQLEELIVKIAGKTKWGSRRIMGALANLGHKVSHQTVLNVLKRHNLPTAPEREKKTTWSEFIKPNLAVTAACDFFSVEVLTLRGLVTYYVLFFIHIKTRRVEIAGITRHPDQCWMEQVARNVTMEERRIPRWLQKADSRSRHQILSSFRELIQSNGIETVRLPARSPNLNASRSAGFGP